MTHQVLTIKGGTMSWDRSWHCHKKGLTFQDFSTAVATVAAEYQGVTTRIEKESNDCWTAFFMVPTTAPEHPDEPPEIHTYEISLYEMGRDGFVLSLEVDASDNRLSEEADQLAEDLAEVLDAESLDL